MEFIDHGKVVEGHGRFIIAFPLSKDLQGLIAKIKGFGVVPLSILNPSHIHVKASRLHGKFFGTQEIHGLKIIGTRFLRMS